MEGEKRKIELEKKDNEIFYSRAIKAGKRIYYLDVKKSRNEDLYLAITESKKKVVGYDEDARVTYEKHKIFLYKEDFEKFVEGLQDVIEFIKQEQGEPTPRPEYTPTPEELSESSNTSEASNNTEIKSNGGSELSDESGDTKRSFFDKFKF